MAAMLCCSYKTSRRGLLLATMLTFIFSIVFLGVGSVSVRFGNSFINEANLYCSERCYLTADPNSIVGCNCDGGGHTELPTVVFLSPAIGLIIVGIFTFFTSILGCAGAIRERNIMLSTYICCILLVIILQFSFGVAAATVATGDSSAIQEPLHAVLKKNYQEFDWMSLDIFFPAACYKGQKMVNITEPLFAGSGEFLYHFPLCDFDGDCIRDDRNADDALKAAQNGCCTAANKCNTALKDTCISGDACVTSFLGRVGAPVAVVAFLALVIEVCALVFACVIRLGQPGNKDRYGDRA